MPEVERRKAEFRGSVENLAPLDVVRRHIIYGSCFALLDEQYYKLRRSASDEFDVHPNEIVVVGSGKLGFSVAPGKMLRPFGDHSDIDLAIVSPTLFDEAWQSVFQYSRTGGYWPDRDRFCSYLLQGWIRPDKLPPEKTFEFGRRWWTFFRNISATGEFGPYKVRGALYRSWTFLEGYHEDNIAQFSRTVKGST